MDAPLAGDIETTEGVGENNAEISDVFDDSDIDTGDESIEEPAEAEETSDEQPEPIDFESYGFKDVEKVKETVTKIFGENVSKEQAENLLNFFKEELEKESESKNSNIETKKTEIANDYGISKKEFTDLQKWTSAQSEEVQSLARQLTSLELPVENIRAGIKLLNLVKTGGAKKIGGSTNAPTKTLTKESIRTEYEKALTNKDSKKIQSLKARAMNELTGEDREWAKIYLS